MNSPYYNPQFREIPEHPIVKLKPDPKCIFFRVNPFQTIVMILQLLIKHTTFLNSQLFLYALVYHLR